MEARLVEFRHVVRRILRKPYLLTRRIFHGPLPSKLSNVEYNRALWDRYAKEWSKTWVDLENPDIGEKERDSYVKHLGDEWGRTSHVERIVAEYIYPYITPESVVAEIGSGGGRIASRVVERAKELYCLDISSEMLKRTHAALSRYDHVRYALLKGPRLPEELGETLDFIYSFDVFVHLDLHTIWKYFKEIRRCLKSGGRAFVHTTNLKAPGGWERFAGQEKYSVAGHYYISPEIVEILADRSGLRIIKMSNIDPSNVYLNRDYLVMLEK